MTKIKPTVLAAAAIALLLSLSGCVGETNNTGATTPSTIGTPTPDPESESTVVAEIRMSAVGLSFVNESGTQLNMIHVTDDPAASVALLTESLGFEPVTSSAGQIGSWGLATRYGWDGLVLQVRQNPDNPAEHDVKVNFVASTSGSVRLVGPGGVRVGDPAQSLPPRISVGSYEGTGNLPRYLLGDPTPIDWGADDIFDYYVEAIEGSTGGAVIELWAPASSVFPGYTADLITS